MILQAIDWPIIEFYKPVEGQKNGLLTFILCQDTYLALTSHSKHSTGTAVLFLVGPDLTLLRVGDLMGCGDMGACSLEAHSNGRSMFTTFKTNKLMH